MAACHQSTKPRTHVIGSYQTALCIIPPAHVCQHVDRLRASYDKAHGKWPAHLNLVYPFVTVENLPRAVDLIRSKLLNLGPDSQHISDVYLRLDTADHFSHRQSNTVYVAPSDQSGGENLKHLRNAILEAFKQSDDTYRPHLTIGQSPANAPPLLEWLRAKAQSLLPIQWQVEELVVLVRERTNGLNSPSSQMKVWGTINMRRTPVIEDGLSLTIPEKPPGLEERSDEEMRIVKDKTQTTQLGTTYQFSPSDFIWGPV